MNTFKDSKGRDWKIAINIGTVEQVLEDVGVDLMQPESGDPPLMTRLGTDELLLAKVIASLISGQFESRNTTVDDVKESFDGKSMLDATSIFYEQMRSFFLSRGRADRAAMIAKQVQMMSLGVPAITKRVNEIDAAKTIDGIMSGASPESLV